MLPLARGTGLVLGQGTNIPPDLWYIKEGRKEGGMEGGREGRRKKLTKKPRNQERNQRRTK